MRISDRWRFIFGELLVTLRWPFTLRRLLKSVVERKHPFSVLGFYSFYRSIPWFLFCKRQLHRGPQHCALGWLFMWDDKPRSVMWRMLVESVVCNTTTSVTAVNDGLDPNRRERTIKGRLLAALECVVLNKIWTEEEYYWMNKTLIKGAIPRPRVSFDTSLDEDCTILEIVRRVLAYPQARAVAGHDLHMCLSACHKNGCPLDLERLLASDTPNLLHDALGIYRSMDRETGRLRGDFLPRCRAIVEQGEC